MQNIHRKNSTKKRRLKKSIREMIVTFTVSLIGGAILAAMFFGAAIQEQDKLAMMAVAEVQTRE